MCFYFLCFPSSCALLLRHFVFCYFFISVSLSLSLSARSRYTYSFFWVSGRATVCPLFLHYHHVKSLELYNLTVVCWSRFFFRIDKTIWTQSKSGYLDKQRTQYMAYRMTPWENNRETERVCVCVTIKNPHNSFVRVFYSLLLLFSHDSALRRLQSDRLHVLVTIKYI